MVSDWRGNNVQSQTTLVDILDKILDKGLVIAGDIRVSLANVELLTIKIRLLVCSIDKATEIGLDWWRHDDFLGGTSEAETAALRARIEALERQLAGSVAPPTTESAATSQGPAEGRSQEGRTGGNP